MSGHFETLLESITRDPSSRLDSFEMLTAEEAKEEVMEKMERHQSQMSRLRSAKRRSVDLLDVRGIKTGYLQPGETLPLVVEPRADEVDLPEWAGRDKAFIEKSLLKHGAILFRGFNVESAAEFESFAASLCPELFGEYGDLPREEVSGKIYGSTPYPSDEAILFHNESSHMHRWPMLIWFCCIKPAEQGGETPIVDCRKIYQQMGPTLRDRFEQKGLMYIRNFTDDLDVSWQDFFHTRDRTAVGDYCRKAAIDFEWRQGNGLRTREICPAVINHPQTAEKVFFNQLQLHHMSCLAPAVRESLLSMMKEEDLPRNVYYGDGSAIEDAVMDELRELYWKTAVSFSWQAHDVLMVNNMLVAHARNPYVGQRKIVVAMGNMITREQVACLNGRNPN
jgi:alpha-ketoglutarate-dependent taurine dioxygenase